MNIVIMGTGNVATQLGRLIYRSGHKIVQVYGRNLTAAESLAHGLDARAISEVSDIVVDADLYILAVADGAIGSLVEMLPPVKGMLVHTAGSVSMDVLHGKATEYGVLYPLQSLRKESEQIPEIPFLIEANHEKSLGKLQEWASGWSNRVVVVDGMGRQKLHLSAVILNNFVNHLYTLTNDYCKQEDLDFQLLLPLIKETVLRLNGSSPDQFQTGPAMRKDTASMQKHQLLLTGAPDLQEVYQLFSRKITAYYHSAKD